MFQVKRMVSNMLGGAIELASNDSETVTPALRMRSSASRGLPARPSRNSESVAHDSGVLVLAISSASTSRAGTKWQSSRFGPSQPRFSKSTVSTQFGGVCAACSAIGSLRSSAAGHVDQECVRRALRMAAQVQAEADEPVERGAVGEILVLDAVDVGEAHRLVPRHQVDVAVGVASAQHRFAMGAQFGVGVRGRARVVRPVVHGGDAGVGQLDQAEPDAGVEVLRPYRASRSRSWPGNSRSRRRRSCGRARSTCGSACRRSPA